MNKLINIENMDREEALLLYKGKIYIDGNHQFALKQALQYEGISLDIETDIDGIAKITHNMSKENEICTLDLYEDNLKNKYLISHFEENLILNLNLLRTYAKKNNYILGYFVDFNGEVCKLLENI